jgi:transcriptional regulator with PAS, ATPase and Fis domain
VVEINIPPLRERPEDIVPLATAFIAEFTKGKARFSSAVAEALSRYDLAGQRARIAQCHGARGFALIG